MTTLAPPLVSTFRATEKDAPRLLACLEQLARTSAYTKGTDVNREHLAATLDRMLANDDVGFLVAQDDAGTVVGMLVVMLYDHLLSGERGAAEVCWYVAPEHRQGLGLALLHQAEQWACEQGATSIEMLAPESKFESVFRRRGYVLTDRVYKRRVPCRG